MAKTEPDYLLDLETTAGKKADFIGPGSDVPFISQLDDVKDPKWQTKFCGVVSVYMVLSFWWKKQNIPNPPSLKDVSDYGLKIGGYTDESGWIHAKLAQVARRYHYTAVSRSWFLRESDLEILLNQERLDSGDEVERYSEQIVNEFLTTLKRELSKGVPVILSVKPRFGKNGDSHLIVVTSVAEDLSAVTIHDPQSHASSASQKITTEHLLKFSNFSAIFIYS